MKHMEIDAYLKRINHKGSCEPTVDNLSLLHLAHLRSVPFENIDIHLGHPITLSLPSLYDKIVRRRRGGFCYELNGLFAWLLEQLGFKVTMLSARVFNGPQPGPEFDHLLLLVELEDRMIADVGFGDSFLEPLELDSSKKDTQPNGLYQFTESDSETILRRRQESEWESLYTFSLVPHHLDEFGDMCHHHQTSPNSHFTQKVVCSMATTNGRITLSNNHLIITAGKLREERMLESEDEYRMILNTHFGIKLGEGGRIDRLTAAGRTSNKLEIGEDKQPNMI